MHTLRFVYVLWYLRLVASLEKYFKDVVIVFRFAAFWDEEIKNINNRL